MNSLRDSPFRTWAWRLGPAGLLPFVVLALAGWLGPDDWLPAYARAQLAYAAVIASFVGALHWGLALSPDSVPDRMVGLALGWSVAPSLVAWIALLLDNRPGLVLMAALLVIALGVDLLLYRRYRIAWITPWFLRLRALLTVVAVASLLAMHALLPAASAG
jgi:hypothetical protein